MQLINYIHEMYELALLGEKQGIVFFAAMYFFLCLVYIIIYRLKLSKWKHIKGELIESRVVIFGYEDNTPTYTTKVLYKYEVDGVKYEGSRLSPVVKIATGETMAEKDLSKIQSYSDGSIRVWFNPKKPNKSYLIKDNFWFLFFSIILSIVIGFLILQLDK